MAARYPYGTGTSPTKGFANYVWRSAYAKPILATTGGASYGFYNPYEMWMRLPGALLQLDRHRLGPRVSGCGRLW